uniref:Uncharacterized protein n=1 Tax=Oryza sativa subsp. japonica TaxID=39947 RepID=Q6K2N7_ORYSJ|nr:hypothetical protein [Oryza sativa Japonica Group]
MQMRFARSKKKYLVGCNNAHRKRFSTGHQTSIQSKGKRKLRFEKVEIIIQIHDEKEKCMKKTMKKAMKKAASVTGVQSVTLCGGNRNLLMVIGEGVDTNKLLKKLRNNVGAADIVETMPAEAEEFEAAAAVSGSKNFMKMMPRWPKSWSFVKQESLVDQLNFPRHSLGVC